MAIRRPTGPPERYRFSVEEYERMGETGILAEDDRVELIAGEIVAMSPMGPRHADCLATVDDILHEQVGKEARIIVQTPIRLSDDSEPEPDLALVQRRRYRQALPTPADVLLVIEVADSSREYDRAVKLPLYAAEGIAEAWLFDLVTRTIERHTDPHDGRYTLIAVAGRGQSRQSTILPRLTFVVDEIFG